MTIDEARGKLRTEKILLPEFGETEFVVLREPSDEEYLAIEEVERAIERPSMPAPKKDDKSPNAKAVRAWGIYNRELGNAFIRAFKGILPKVITDHSFRDNSGKGLAAPEQVADLIRSKMEVLVRVQVEYRRLMNFTPPDQAKSAS